MRNVLILNLSMADFNILRLIGQRALEKSALLPLITGGKRKRIRKLVSDLIRIGYRLFRHGRRWILRINGKNPWLPVFRELYPNC